MSDYQTYKTAEATRINGIFYGIVFLAGMALYSPSFSLPLGMVFALSFAGIGMGYWYVTDWANHYICEVLSRHEKKPSDRNIRFINTLNDVSMTGQLFTFVCAVAAWVLWFILSVLHVAISEAILSINERARWGFVVIGIACVCFALCHIYKLFTKLRSIPSQFEADA